MHLSAVFVCRLPSFFSITLGIPVSGDWRVAASYCHALRLHWQLVRKQRAACVLLINWGTWGELDPCVFQMACLGHYRGQGWVPYILRKTAILLVCVCVYTAVEKFGIAKIFKGVSYAHQGGIYLIKTNKHKKKKTVIPLTPNF